MYTLGYSFRPWTSPKAIADGDAILAYVRETAARTASIARSATGIASSARGGRATTRAGRSTCATARPATRSRSTCRFLFVCAGYYDYDAGYTPDVRRPRAVPRPHRAPAEVDARHRLRRQARRRDRQRRDRGDAGARAREARGARDDAAALADVHRVACPRSDRDRRLAARARLPSAPRTPPTRWKNVLLGMAFYAFCRRFPEQAKRAPRRPGRREQLRGTSDVAAALHADVQAVGPAPVPRARRRSVRGDPRRARLGRHRSHRDVHRDRASRCAPARSSTPTSSSPRPASSCKFVRRDRARGRRRARRSVAADGLQGHDVQRRPELRVRGRLHERVVDAEVRSHEQLRVPAARSTWTSTATRAAVRAAAIRPSRRSR